MEVDVMWPAFNLEPKYRVIRLMREDWTKVTSAPAVKGLVWFTDGSKMREGTRAGMYGQSVGRRLSFYLGRSSSSSFGTITLCGFSPSQPSLSKFFYP